MVIKIVRQVEQITLLGEKSLTFNSKESGMTVVMMVEPAGYAGKTTSVGKGSYNF